MRASKNRDRNDQGNGGCADRFDPCLFSDPIFSNTAESIPLKESGRLAVVQGGLKTILKSEGTQ
jgi:hypothetical protein